jgi:peptidoglycan/LPS O-acetylase OafA/YrhL
VSLDLPANTDSSSSQLPPNPTPPLPATYYFGIDALRGLAALAVVFYHVRIYLWVGLGEIRAHPALYSALDRKLAYLSVPMAFGGAGVMLFFLLSGFCIHLPNARRSNLELKTYFARRLLRIYPPYLAALLLSLGLEMAMRHFHAIEPSTSETILRSLFLVQNYADPVTQVRLNVSLWSLPVEIEMYLVYPLLWMLWRRSGAATAWIVVAMTSSLALALFYWKDWPQITHNFAMFWVIWFAGAWLAQKAATGNLPPWRRAYWLWPLAVGAVCAAVVIKKGHESPLLHWGWALCCLPILWQSLSWTPREGSLKKSLTWLGRISFSLYLIHGPFLQVSGLLWASYFGSKPANLLVAIAFSALSLLVAEIFYRTVELPSHRLARGWGRSKIAA